jgi:RimJ/RimL family protein N-acetyltransferase
LKIHPRIGTERLRLRPYVAEDAAALALHGGAAAIADTMLDWPHPFSAANARSTIAAQAASYQAGRAVHFVVERGAEPGLVGGIELADLDERNRRGALRFWIAEPLWGQGYAREAAGAVVRFGFRDLGLHRVDAMRLVRCERGGAVLRAIGMREEGILRERVRIGGKWEDVALAAALSGDDLPAAVGAPALEPARV